MSEGCRQQQDDRQLALLPTTLRQGDEEAGLSREVGALRGLLARVAPQLEELVGVKQQMCHLLSVLQPGVVLWQHTVLQLCTSLCCKKLIGYCFFLFLFGLVPFVWCLSHVWLHLTPPMHICWCLVSSRHGNLVAQSCTFRLAVAGEAYATSCTSPPLYSIPGNGTGFSQLVHHQVAQKGCVL